MDCCEADGRVFDFLISDYVLCQMVNLSGLNWIYLSSLSLKQYSSLVLLGFYFSSLNLKLFSSIVLHSFLFFSTLVFIFP